jgi:hypothetical protein
MSQQLSTPSSLLLLNPKELREERRVENLVLAGHSFTGKKEDIDLLSKKLGLYFDPKLSKDGHTPHLLIGNEATGQWQRDTAADNPKFLANLIGNVMSSWKYASAAAPKKSYSEAAAT